jgi:hypothetical protein
MGRMRRLATIAVLVAVTAAAVGATALPASAQEPTELWRPAPGSVPDVPTYVHLESGPGDFVGQGLRHTYVRADTDIKVAAFGGRIDVSVYGEQDWRATFHPPRDIPQVVEARYEGIGEPGGLGDLRWGGEGRGCNERRGWYVVDDVAYSGTQLTRLHMRFEQWCDSSPAPLRGEVHWDAADPNPGAPTPTRPVPQTLYRPNPDVVPATGSYLYLNGQPGAFVGDAQSYLYPAEVLHPGLFLDVRSGPTLELRVRTGEDAWNIRMVASNRADALLPGYYRRIGRVIAHNPVRGGFSASGNGRGCNRSWSDVAIDEIDIRTGQITDLALRFSQRCDESIYAFRGELRWQPRADRRGLLAPPATVTATQTGASATVGWPAVPDEAGAPVTGYEVTTFRDGLAVGTKVVDAATTSTTITGLAASATHSFKVAVITEHGTGGRPPDRDRSGPLGRPPHGRHRRCRHRLRPGRRHRRPLRRRARRRLHGRVADPDRRRGAEPGDRRPRRVGDRRRRPLRARPVVHRPAAGGGRARRGHRRARRRLGHRHLVPAGGRG